jgi:uncharacterized protein (DUF1697 family)
MPRLFAFLRAINVGGHTVTMKALCGTFISLGFSDAESFIASGNVVFSSRSGGGRALEKRIEDALRRSLGYEVATFVRTAQEVSAIARYEPFTASKRQAAGALVVGFVAEPLGSAGIRALEGLKTDIDDFEVRGREIYWLCRRKQSESTFSNAVFEKALKVRATFRSVSTVLRLAAKYSLLDRRAGAE